MEYRLRETALSWRDVNGELIALDAASDTYLGANAAGRLLWKMLAQGATESELVDCLVVEFDLKRLDASADVSAFVGELQTAGLLED
jgi:coenzyme PQQ synthesis protein D (PqqD)